MQASTLRQTAINNSRLSSIFLVCCSKRGGDNSLLAPGMNLNKQTLQPPTNLRKETINVLVGEIKKVRKHSSKLIFVTISILQRGGDDSINNTPLQLAIQPQNSKLLETSYRKQHKLLKPHVKIHASGIYGHTKTKTKTLFVTDFYIMKFLPGIHSSVLWLFLQVLEEKVIDMEVGCSYVNEALPRMETILTLKKHDKNTPFSTQEKYLRKIVNPCAFAFYPRLKEAIATVENGFNVCAKVVRASLPGILVPYRR